MSESPEPAAPADTPEGCSSLQTPPDSVSKNPQGANPAMSAGEIKPNSNSHQNPDPTRYGDWEKNGRCIDF
ncbi:MAG: DUF1674 domain-containing protein [Alphaproteobacteria bacterium]|nr:DUF1674 domain-containing protein [Alphaproteobacteria bacterium]